MKWVTYKDSQGKLSDVDFEIERVDASITAVTFTQKGKPVLKCSYTGYRMEVSVPAPPVIVERWKLHGDFMGLTPIELIFEHEHEAQEKLSKFIEASGYQDSKVNLTIEKIEIPE